jgi:AcrR family transcriptional regulator
MTIPQVSRRRPWAGLDQGDKRRRVLEAATAILTDAGLGASMPAIAGAAGVGVGTVYRCFPSKDDLIAAIVVEQMSSVRAEIEESRQGADAGSALETMLLRLVDRQAHNNLVKAALAATSERPEVEAAVGEVSLAWQELLDRARRDGRIRATATTTDLRLLFAAARAAEDFGGEARERVVELILDGLRLNGRNGAGR